MYDGLAGLVRARLNVTAIATDGYLRPRFGSYP